MKYRRMKNHIYKTPVANSMCDAKCAPITTRLTATAIPHIRNLAQPK